MIIELTGRIKENTGILMRRFGYAPHFDRYKKEMTYVKKIHGSMFPRFHVHIWEEKQEYIKLNIHLDAKRESYSGVSMHSGEYDSPVVVKEAERIRQIFSGLLLSLGEKQKEIKTTKKSGGSGGIVGWFFK